MKKSESNLSEKGKFDIKIVILLLSFILTFICIPSSFANPIKQIFEAATRALQSEDYDRAITLYEKTLELYPDFALSYYYLGLAHKAIGTDTQEVIWLFKKATELNPNYAQAFDNLSRLYFSMGMLDEAEEAGLQALKINPELTSAHISLGWIYILGKSEPRNAIYHFEKVLEKEKVSYAYFGLGIAYVRDNQKFRALEMITALRQLGEEASASQLENMVHSGADIQPLKLSPLARPQRTRGVIVKETPSFSSSNFGGGNMKVRLKEKIETVEKQPQGFSIQKPRSSTNRVRALQRKAISQPKGSGY